MVVCQFWPTCRAPRAKALGLPSLPLRDLAKLSLPHRFERVWAAGGTHGPPCLNATDLLSRFAVGLPTKTRFLPKQSVVDVPGLIIRQN